MGDWDWVGPVAAAGGSFLNSTLTSEEASKISQAAYEQMLANLRDRFGDYDKLGTAGYEQYVPAQLGASALAGVEEDPALRLAQQDTLAALKDIIDSGGLTLADMKALGDVERRLNQQNAARRKGVLNSFAARGQLGSGAQLAAELDSAQDAAELANQRGEGIAAQAQDRRMQALMKRGEFARGMSADDVRRQTEAAQADDFIKRWNASALNDGSKYRNTVKGQAFEDELSKARGKTSLTNSYNEALGGQARDKVNTTTAQGAYRNDLLKAGGNAASSFGSGSSNSDASSTGSKAANGGAAGAASAFGDDDEENP